MTKRRRWIAVPVAVAALLVTAGALAAHDLFLRLDSYFVSPGSDARILVLNGTFSSSENAVDRNRLRALDLATGARVEKLDTSAWAPSGDTTIFTVHTRESGTYLAGASLLPRSISLTAEQFNEYLRTDGVPDVLERRRRGGALQTPAKELYEKHVKALFQVGDTRSGGFDRVFGYPAELVPLGNPYALAPGATLRVRALVDGRPMPRQFVLWGGRTPRGERIAQRGTRTDSTGVARIGPLRAGVWYVKFIRMVPVTGDTVDYHSKWATLSFAISTSRD